MQHITADCRKLKLKNGLTFTYNVIRIHPTVLDLKRTNREIYDVRRVLSFLGTKLCKQFIITIL